MPMRLVQVMAAVCYRQRMVCASQHEQQERKWSFSFGSLNGSMKWTRNDGGCQREEITATGCLAVKREATQGACCYEGHITRSLTCLLSLAEQTCPPSHPRVNISTLIGGEELPLESGVFHLQWRRRRTWTSAWDFGRAPRSLSPAETHGRAQQKVIFFFSLHQLIRNFIASMKVDNAHPNQRSHTHTHTRSLQLFPWNVWHWRTNTST